MDPKQEYEARLANWMEQRAAHETRHRGVGAARLGMAVLLLILIWGAGKTLLAVEIGFTGLIVALFLSGMLHDRVLRKRDRAQRAVDFYRNGLARLNDEWIGRGVPGSEFLDPLHPYASDLDIFGTGSVFELVNAAQTQLGRATLAKWLLHRSSLHEIQTRQSAVVELRDKLDLRQDVALLAPDLRKAIDTGALVAWSKGPRLFDSAGLRAVAFFLPLLTWIFFFSGHRVGFLVCFIGQLILAWCLRGKVRRVLGTLTPSANDLQRLGGIFQRLEQEAFSSPRLQPMQQRWQEGNNAASVCFRKLGRTIDWLDSGENLLVSLAGRFVLLETQSAFFVEAQRARYAGQMGAWLNDLGELEALLSLAGYAFEHPRDPFPEFLDESAPPRLQGEGIGHPLIPSARCVLNDVRLAQEHRLIVISGSNMSGKSTWLRALGVNMVLAMAGAPVRAARLRLTPVQIGASITTTDSLNAGISRFYAEIKRLSQLATLAEKDGRLVFFIDELLNGTNSHDRRIGAGLVIKRLLENGAIGLLTTHDLALTQIVTEIQPPGENFHFQDDIIAGKMSFDYRLRAGVVEKSNALELMRSIGLG